MQRIITLIRRIKFFKGALPMTNKLFKTFALSSVVLFSSMAQAAAPRTLNVLASVEGLERVGQLLGQPASTQKVAAVLTELGLPSARVQTLLKDPNAARAAISEGLQARSNDSALDARIVALLGGEATLTQWEAKGLTALKQTQVRQDGALAAIGNGQGTLSLAKKPSVKAVGAEGNAVVETLNQLARDHKVDAKVAQEFQVKLAQSPKALELVGSGFTKGCGNMRPQAVTNLVTSYIAGALWTGSTAIARAVRTSLQKATGASEAQARRNVCKLSTNPCNLYGAPIQQACAAGVAF